MSADRFMAYRSLHALTRERFHKCRGFTGGRTRICDSDEHRIGRLLMYSAMDATKGAEEVISVFYCK